MKLLISHTPSKIYQNMLLFKASQLLEEYQVIDDEYNHWCANNSGDIIAHNIKADHETIIYPENSLQILDILKLQF